MVPEHTSLGVLQGGTAKMSNFKDNDKIHYYEVRTKCESALLQA